ncbi:hypothetical protein SAMN03159444_02145 [Pseudomonas sp. NFACC02]|nr:hypothetical protein SAMN03159444_02145 [Pseudomonas sp. NFACC02]
MPATATGAVGLALLLSLWFNIVMFVIFALKNLNFLEGCLSSSPCIALTKGIWGDGVIGRHMRINMIFLAVTFPSAMCRRGYIRENDNFRVPYHFKLRLWILYTHLSLNLLVLMILGYVIETT